MRDLRAAAWQCESKTGDVEANLAALEKALVKAGDVDLFVAPEMFATGWHPERAQDATLPGGDLETRIGDLARDHATWFATSIHTRRGAQRHNTFTLWNDAGSVVHRQDKVHLWADEAKHLTPGANVAAADARFARLGGMVCYDIEFPELSRSLAKQGAELLLLPAGFYTAQTWDLMTRTRPLENGCFLVAGNLVGGSGPKPQCGSARIVDPWGTVLAKTRGRGSSVAVATLKQETLAAARAWSPYLQDRRLVFA